MKVKIIASDLDGTLLNDTAGLTPPTAECLKKAHQNGIKIVFATGRAFEAMPAQIKEFPFADYVICSNGAAIYSLRKKELLKSHVLDKNSALALIRFATENSLGLELITQGKAYGEKYYFEHPEAFGFDERSIRYLNATRTKIENLDTFVNQNLHQLESIDFVLKEPHQRDKIKSMFSDNSLLYITSSHPRIIEFSARGCGKANALRYILEKEKLSQRELIAFGNADNDLEMLFLAHMGVATANSPASVQRAADAVCPSCNEDGVAVYLNELLKEIKKERD